MTKQCSRHRHIAFLKMVLTPSNKAVHKQVDVVKCDSSQSKILMLKSSGIHLCSLLSAGLDAVLGHGTLDDGFHGHCMRVYGLLSQRSPSLTRLSPCSLSHPCNTQDLLIPR